jgi:hypothetical protein
MSGSSIMLFAIAVAMIGSWAHGHSPGVKAVIEAVFAVLVIAFLDQGATEGIARGLAWIFLAAVLLSNNSPLQALARVTAAPAKSPKPGVQAV